MQSASFEPQFPVQYGRSRLASALYVADARRFEHLLADLPLRAVRFGSQGLVSLTWFDYESSALGPYQELSIGIVVDTNRSLFDISLKALLRAAPTLGTYVLALPLSNEDARDAGVRYLGLPKELMQLPLTWSKTRLDATAVKDGLRVLSMTLPLHIGPRTRVPRLTVYSKLDGRTLRTIVETDLAVQMDFVGRPRLRLEAPEHPLCVMLTRLGLPAARCLALFHGTIRSAQLLAPESL
ncbi:MAG: acetoacetate decarboxylase family protein [Polyangiaceae bacterium]